MLDPTNITVATMIGGTVFYAVVGGTHMLVQGNKLKRARQNLRTETLSYKGALAYDHQDVYSFVPTEMNMCGGCGLIVPVGSRPTDHDCDALKNVGQTELFPRTPVDITA